MSTPTEHPRIVLLRTQVMQLPVGGNFRQALLQSITTYRTQIIDRPDYAPDQGWDDLLALTQVTWGDALEQHLQHLPNTA